MVTMLFDRHHVAVNPTSVVVVIAITISSMSSFSRVQHLPADGHRTRERHVLRVHTVGVRGGRVLADAVLLRADLHVTELRDPSRCQRGGFSGPQNIRLDRHQLRVHRARHLLRLHRIARLSAHRRHQVKNIARLLLPHQLVRQPVPLHHTHSQFQTRSLLDSLQVSST